MTIVNLNKISFERIYNTYYEPLCSYLLVYTNDIELVKDIVQSSFVQLWEDRKNAKISFIKTYLYVMARNKMLNQLRDEKRRNNILSLFMKDEQSYSEAAEIIDLNTFGEWVEHFVTQLPEKTQEAYRLSREERMSNIQIAELQNVSIKTINNQISTANRFLIDSLKEFSERNQLSICVLLSLLQNNSFFE